METINSKLLNWASILDEKTREQALATSTLPFIYPHLALMPDAHLGKGATVGSVIPTLHAIIPAAVGVDIGCGMIAVRTQYSLKDLPKDRKRLREAIERAIPLSAGHNNRKVTASAEPRLAELRKMAAQAGFNPAQYLAKWELQLGSLGSGNHFIEVCADETDAVWLFLHSGSRGVGNKIAQHHIGVAQHGDPETRNPTARSGPRLPGGRHQRVHPVHRGTALGPALRPPEPGRNDGACDHTVRQLGGRPRQGAGADQLPPQLHAAGNGTTASPCGCRARARSGPSTAIRDLFPGPWGRRRTLWRDLATPCR